MAAGPWRRRRSERPRARPRHGIERGSHGELSGGFTGGRRRGAAPEPKSTPASLVWASRRRRWRLQGGGGARNSQGDGGGGAQEGARARARGVGFPFYGDARGASPRRRRPCLPRPMGLGGPGSRAGAGRAFRLGPFQVDRFSFFLKLFPVQKQLQ
jgi:hypothetical protein